MKVLMVCLGNICRSPIAEGVMKEKFTEHGIKGTVDSAGVISYHAGSPPDKRAISVSHKYHVDISEQRARQFRKSDFDEFDLILTMDESVHQDIIAMADSLQSRQKTQLFLEYAGHTGSFEVPDPYWGGASGFDSVFNLISENCERIAQKIKQSY